MTTDEATQIRQQIENLGNRMQDQFDRVRGDMVVTMKAYVLDAVHQKDLERLDDKDNKQQEQLDALQAKIDGMLIKHLTIVGAVLSIIITALGILHLGHFL